MSSSVNTLSTREHLIIHNTMQGLCLDNNEREKTMNCHFALTADSDTVLS